MKLYYVTIWNKEEFCADSEIHDLLIAASDIEEAKIDAKAVYMQKASFKDWEIIDVTEISTTDNGYKIQIQE